MLFSFFFKYLFSSRSGALIRTISFICVLGIGASSASLVVVMSVMTGFGASIRERLLQGEPHLVVYPAQKKSSALLSDNELLDEKIRKIFSKNEELNQNVEFVRSFETQDLIIKTKEGLFAGAVGRGYEKKELQKIVFPFESSNLKETNPHIEWDDDDKDSLLPEIKKVLPLEAKNNLAQPAVKNLKEVFLGSELAGSVAVFEGDAVSLFPAESLLLPPSEAPLYEEALAGAFVYFDSSSVYSKDVFYELDSLPQLSDTASLQAGTEVFLKNPSDYSSLAQVLKEQGFRVQTWAERHSSLLFALKIEKWIMFLFLSLAGVIAGFSLSSVISLLITQKRADIGMLMAMGRPLKKIKSLFVQISLLISFMGILGGLVLGYLVCLFIKHSPVEIFPEIYYERKFPVEMNPEIFMSVFFFAVLLAVIISFLSVYSQNFHSPVQWIRKARA